MNRVVKLTGKYCRCPPYVASVWTTLSLSSAILWGTRNLTKCLSPVKRGHWVNQTKCQRGSCCRWPSTNRHTVAMSTWWQYGDWSRVDVYKNYVIMDCIMMAIDCTCIYHKFIGPWMKFFKVQKFYSENNSNWKSWILLHDYTTVHS